MAGGFKSQLVFEQGDQVSIETHTQFRQSIFEEGEVGTIINLSKPAQFLSIALSLDADNSSLTTQQRQNIGLVVSHLDGTELVHGEFLSQIRVNIYNFNSVSISIGYHAILILRRKSV